MKRWIPVLCVSCAALLALAVQPSRSGDDAPAAKAEASRSRVRLPNNYGQLGLTPEQRERIYAVQAEYAQKIEQLEAQLAALREQRDKQCQALLTPEQRARLAAILKDREQQKAERAKAAKAARASATP